MLELRVTGIDKTMNYIRDVYQGMPQYKERLEQALAQDIVKGARYRVSTRLSQKTGRLYESIHTLKVGEHWTAVAGGEDAPHAVLHEFGIFPIEGYHFVPKVGEGRHGEGFMARGGTHPGFESTRFMRDAMESTDKRALSIGERIMKEHLKE